MRYSTLLALSLANILVTAAPISSGQNQTLANLAASQSSGVQTNCKNPGTFAMSFDDGAYTYGSTIADYFSAHDSHASFFVNGNNYGCIYDHADDLLARYNAGHMIGAHTWGHDNIAKLSADDLDIQITLVETALMKILGVKPRFFRPPFGSYSKESIKILKSRGYTVVTWSFDSGDSVGMSSDDSISAYNELYAKFPAPGMALNHETYADTANNVVPAVVPQLLSAGYSLVTVAECLGLDPYQSIGTPGTRDDTWTCKGTPRPGATR